MKDSSSLIARCSSPRWIAGASGACFDSPLLLSALADRLNAAADMPMIITTAHSAVMVIQKRFCGVCVFMSFLALSLLFRRGRGDHRILTICSELPIREPIRLSCGCCAPIH